MKTIKNGWIKLKENIDQEDYKLIKELEKRCINNEKITLKLELDYKLGDISKNINEFMYFDENELIGYIGICSFAGAGSVIEVNGMVHPQYRRHGIFKTLFALVLDEWRKRSLDKMLLLCDRYSRAGQEFIKVIGAMYKHSEYEMYLRNDSLELLNKKVSGITLRKAANEDALEIARQNSIYFNSMESIDNLILPEEEEKKGMTIYIAEKDNKAIGKVHVELISGNGGIYGLGVLPKYRSQGFGRAILKLAIEKLREHNANEIMLQVEAENSNALNLYKSCGFMETSTMDYFEIKA